MSRKPTIDQQARFELFCTFLAADIRQNAYRAAIKAGYTARMAKSKSYLLGTRAMKIPKVRKAWRRYADEYAAKVNREYFLRRGRRDALEIIRRASLV